MVQLITVPSCAECNALLQRDESRLRQDLMTLLGPPDTGDPHAEIYERFERGLENWPADDDAILSRLLPHHDKVEFLIPEARTNRVLTMIARGLHYRCVREIVSKEADADAKLLPPDQALDVLKEPTCSGRLGKTFSFKAVVESDGYSGIWWMLFWERVTALVTVVSPDAKT